jgi:hypothetical protein
MTISELSKINPVLNILSQSLIDKFELKALVLKKLPEPEPEKPAVAEPEKSAVGEPEKPVEDSAPLSEVEKKEQQERQAVNTIAATTPPKEPEKMRASTSGTMLSSYNEKRNESVKTFAEVAKPAIAAKTATVVNAGSGGYASASAVVRRRGAPLKN